jgi:HPt (histidine-containing phosphotransfer) domain-containing protein
MIDRPCPPVAEKGLDSGLDRNAIFALVGGNVALLHEIIDIFIAERPAAVAEIDSAIAAGDAARLRLAAHALHGTAGNFRHRPACAAARALEQMGRARDLQGAREAFAVLTDAVSRLERSLLELKSATSA